MSDYAESGQARPGPLVEPAPALTENQLARAARQMILPGFGEIAQRRLAAARVLVIGAGGLGNSSVPFLAGSGVGTIGIIDDDDVEISNLHRQIAYRTADIGRRKVSSLAEVARGIDPGIRVVEQDLRLNSSNALEIFNDYDLVIDGSDNFPTRYLANDAAYLSGIPLVWGAILAHHGQVGVAWHRHGPGYRDLFPVPPSPEEVVSCSSGGVLPGLCGTVGSFLATEALKLITGIGEPLIGRVLVYDALSARTRELSYGADPDAAPITGLIDYQLFCAGPDAPPAISVSELLQLLDESDPIALIDVRRSEERELLRIEHSEALPLSLLESERTAPEALSSTSLIDISPSLSTPALRPSSEIRHPVVVYCATEPRSMRAARLLRARGFNAYYLSGGIELFARVAPGLVTGLAAEERVLTR